MHNTDMSVCPLEKLLATVSQLVPAMQGQLIAASPAGDPAPACDAAPARCLIQQMVAHGERTFPEAGRHYRSLHCWGQWIWQPIYLSVIAVYHSEILPLLSQVSLRHDEGLIGGYAIRHHTPLCGTRQERLKGACRHICTMCSRLRPALAQLMRINQRAFACMQADCLLEALLTSRVHDPAMSPAHLHRRAAQWLHLCGLDGCSSYFEFTQGSGTGIAVRRQTCCQHYRRHGAQHCATCPLLSLDEHVWRLNSHVNVQQAADLIDTIS